MPGSRCIPAPTRAPRAIALLVLVLVLPGTRVADAEPHPAWRRTAPDRFRSGMCRELRVVRRGEGFLELRLGTAALPEVGVDWRMSGASLFLPPEGEHVTLALLHTSGPYVRHLRAGKPIRWHVDGRRICLAAGGGPLACAWSHGDPTSAQAIPFGAGWETTIVPCAPDTVPMRGGASVSAAVVLAAVVFVLLLLWYLGRCTRPRERLAPALLAGVVAWALATQPDPWRVSPLWASAGVTAGVVAVLWRLLRGDLRRAAALILLVASAALAAALVPHPLRLAAGARPGPPAAPPLVVDAASWHFLAPHQRLRRTLDALIARERALGRAIVLLDETHQAQLDPAWYNAWLRRPQETQRQVIRDVAARHGLSLHRVDDAVAALPPAERFLDGMHLTRAGHAAVGARLAAILAAQPEMRRP